MNSVQTPWDEPVSHRRKKKYFQSWIFCSILDTYFRVRWNELQMWLWSKAARSDFDSRKSGDESHHRKFQHCSGNYLLWLLQTELWHLSQRLPSCLPAQLHPEVVAAKGQGRKWALVTGSSVRWATATASAGRAHQQYTPALIWAVKPDTSLTAGCTSVQPWEPVCQGPQGHRNSTTAADCLTK